MFSNLVIYRISPGWAPSLERMEAALDAARFIPCGTTQERSVGWVEPRGEAKGNIARAIFYMHIEYGLPIVGLVPMYKAWHRMDPPDAEEKARNDKIEVLQGTRNRFIDDPALVDQLISD